MSESEDESVPLLPSLEEEFGEGSSGKDTEVKTERRRSSHGAVKIVVIAVIGLVVVLVLIGVVIGITIPLVQRASKPGGGGKVSSTLPTHTTSSSSTTSSSGRISSHLQPETASLSLHLQTMNISTTSDLGPRPSISVRYTFNVSSLPRTSPPLSSSYGGIPNTIRPTRTVQPVFSSVFSNVTVQTQMVQPSATP